MQILETRSELNVKVTVTKGWYVTLRHPTRHPQTKFRVPTLNNIADMLQSQLL